MMGGAVGTLARYLVVRGFMHESGARFPWGTLAVNWLGCLLIGALAALAEGRWDAKHAIHLWLVVGFCGAFTTFSAFIFDFHGLAKTGEHALAVGYLTASVAGGYLFFLLGGTLTKIR